MGNSKGTGENEVIEILSSSDDEGNGKGEASSSSDESEKFLEDAVLLMIECSFDDQTKAEQYLRRHNNNLDDAIAAYRAGGQGSDVENIVYEDRGRDITRGEVLDQNRPTLGSTSNQLLDPASASLRSATQAVERSNAPIRGFETAIAVQNQNRDQDVRSARKRSSSLGDIDERNQPTIHSGM